MKAFLIVLCLCFSSHLVAQKQVDETFNASEVNSVVVDGNSMFKIDIQTQDSKMVQLLTKIEGEYTPEIAVSQQITDSTLYISSVFKPSFANHNDKLSAHKVVSIEVVLKIPKHLKVYVKSDIGSVKAKGDFTFFTVELAQGNCLLTDFFGSALINTINGDVEVHTNYARVKAHSKYGTLTKVPLVYGANTIELNSIHGDIKLIKIEK